MASPYASEINYELRGSLRIFSSDPSSELNQTLPFSFRLHSHSYQLCIYDNAMFPVHKSTCVASDGMSLIYLSENRLKDSSPTNLVPYQAEIRRGRFPPHDHRMFGQVLAGLAPSLLKDLSRDICGVLYPRQHMSDRCATDYSVVSYYDDFYHRHVTTVNTDGLSITSEDVEVPMRPPFDQGYEVLRIETDFQDPQRLIPARFHIEYKYPSAQARAVGDLELMWSINGEVEDVAILSADFSGWPDIGGRTMVHDYRFPVDSAVPYFHYVTTNEWLNAEDSRFQALFSSLSDAAQTSRSRARLWSSLVIACLVLGPVLWLMLLKGGKGTSSGVG